MLVQDILHLSPLRLIACRPDIPIRDAAQRMAQYHVGIVVVMDEDDNFVGVLSERDIVIGLAAADRPIEEILVEDLMTVDIVTVSPGDSLVGAVLAMNRHGIRHLVAAEDDKPVGVLSIRDVLRVFARQLLEDGGEIDGQGRKDFVKALAA